MQCTVHYIDWERESWKFIDLFCPFIFSLFRFLSSSGLFRLLPYFVLLFWFGLFFRGGGGGLVWEGRKDCVAPSWCLGDDSPFIRRRVLRSSWSSNSFLLLHIHTYHISPPFFLVLFLLSVSHPEKRSLLFVIQPTCSVAWDLWTHPLWSVNMCTCTRETLHHQLAGSYNSPKEIF